MKEVERLFWAVGLLLLLPFAVQHGFKVNSLPHMEAPALQSTASDSLKMLSSNAPVRPAAHAAYRPVAGYQDRSTYQSTRFATHQPITPSRKFIGRLTIPGLSIDLPVVSGKGRPGSEHVEVINTIEDLSTEHHIGLATCFDGDASTLARRVRGEWLFLQTHNRLRQYRIVDARMADPLSPHLSLDVDFHSVTLVSCVTGHDMSDHLLVITAIESDNPGGGLNRAAFRSSSPHLKF